MTVQQAVRAFLDEGPRFAQLITVNRAGAPVTRTVGAHVAHDWTVELVARAGHARLRHLVADPWLQLVFVAEPRDPEPVARPAVIDYGRPAPRVVALTGRAEPMNPDETWACYRRQTDHALAHGHTRAPVRAEGFGGAALAETWTPEPAPATGRGTA